MTLQGFTSLYWSVTRQGERLSRKERLSALRTGFITQWPVHADYEIKDGVLRPEGLVRFRYFPADHRDLYLKFARVHNKTSLLEFVKQFGLLGCSLPSGMAHVAAFKRVAPGEITSWNPPEGDDINDALRHAVTVYAISSLIGSLSLAEKEGHSDRVAAEVDRALDKKNEFAFGRGMHGPLDAGPSASVKRSPITTAHWLLRMLINPNIEDIRPVVCAFSLGMSRTFQAFERLIDLIYWQLAQQLNEDRMRKCERPDCREIFTARLRKQIYCGRKCLERDKKRRKRLGVKPKWRTRS